MSLWPSDILANRYYNASKHRESGGKGQDDPRKRKEKRDRTIQEREGRERAYTQAAAERALSPTHIPRQ
jgi:hypothetical protein